MTPIQSFQLAHENDLPVLGEKALDKTYTSIMDGIDKNLDSPCRMHAGFPLADSKLYIEPNRVKRSNGVTILTPPLKKQIANIPLSTLDFQTFAQVGAAFQITFPGSIIPAGQFVRFALTLKFDGSIECSFSAAAATVAALPDAGPLFASGGIPIGYLDLQSTSSVQNAFKTAGSATNIIENEVGGVSRIFTFGSGGAGGGGGGEITTTVQTIAPGGTIQVSTLEGDQTIYVVGQGGPVTTSNTPFGALAVPEGKRITIICLDENATVTIPYNDEVNGAYGNFNPEGGIEISKLFPLTIKRLSDRYFGQRGI